MKKNLYCILSILFLLFIYIILCANSYTRTVSSNISSSIFRLHVIANSDSNEDQNLKYMVRDHVLEYMNTLLDNQNISSRDEILEIISNNLDEFEYIAQNTIYENGYDYDIKIEIGNFPFPTKEYGNISLPSGSYDALRIKIGQAEGKNWWCVMFPPLCFVDVSSGIVPEESKNTLENNLSEEEYKLISENSPDIELKFKFVEFFQELKLLANK